MTRVKPDFSGADLSKINLLGANLSRADLTQANLASAKMTDADLTLSNLMQADLRFVNLEYANLREANLTAANLIAANLQSANFNNARLDRAILSGVRLWNIQRTNWSIKNVTCQTAFLTDKDRPTEYKDGEFERLFTEQQGTFPTNKKPPRRRIPKQVDAPIITDITDHKLIRKPGRTIPKTAPVAVLSEYLAEQFKTIIAELEGPHTNTDKRIVVVFREAETLLQNWTISKLLAFGTHLELVQSCADLLKQELSDPSAHRVDAVIRGSRQFINSFEEWHAYVKASVVFAVEVEGRGDEITGIVEDAARALAQDSESVDADIPSSLDEFTQTASRKGSRQGVGVALMSALRSMKNISITLTEHAAKATQTGFAQLAKNGRALKLVKAICRFQSHATRLAAIYPDLSWLLSHEEMFRAFCDAVGQEKKA